MVHLHGDQFSSDQAWIENGVYSGLHLVIQEAGWILLDLLVKIHNNLVRIRWIQVVCGSISYLVVALKSSEDMPFPSL